MVEAIGALMQLYREQGRYLERIYKWAKRTGHRANPAAGARGPRAPRRTSERFVYAQNFTQADPWAERADGKDAHEFAPLANLIRMEAAE